MSEKAIARKKIVVDELKDRISRSSLLVIADYVGFTVKDLTGLRKKLRPTGGELKIIKNTLIHRAASECGYEGLKDNLKGSTALLLGYDDPVAPLKIMVEYFKEIEKGTMRAGIVNKLVFDEKQLKEISKLPPRDVLLGKVVGGLQAPISGLVNVLQGPIRKLVYALQAIKDKKGGE
ncbi:50S ribosomal protein L10 [candidate division WOR-1 bacterium RIFOXYA12_FULL_52_29]|uniref:Large ribosomal subunit protein uL10 n=1 Tax=candidate division WOR-1 bacterium RIFOXYC12_FULL_54_18 TaxID=1802584 RepID=A0A1F4T5E4_UNCSA|nr:MAG: 50S ribosomal protein L10 [candidate division WOR-1 bacterium RIFOXYA2_FULL_51_19]OGC17598.1 MAG: 50S ribosomal protein L10 [candidate division WOR-1 bacterium RIFOXYA12_FULL_52_29]OGC26455.1 MAG: 50S ribosomal protein L10 [candidate division WOR-1 bacterium RIFOXYB2_FULL_45_9]OGC28015.1 MAG: 50S ribosomal protein L10 [candidate division WOR-1 bacterium RIFOXYC12_FULL_54_18]OGC29699.1 MAG: 50S ribosomal protein L10 [candidate division WOR-1 bacterium RIFOXYB12_FULL_52_16]